MEKVRTEKMQLREGRKVAKHCVFPMFCGYGGSKSRLAKAAGAEPAGQRRKEKLHILAAQSTFGSENVKSTRALDRFLTIRWRFDVKKVHAFMAGSTFPSQTC